MSEIRTALQEPVTIVLKGGNQQTGQITRWDESQLMIEVSLGGGTAELTFPAGDIRSIRFPGAEYKRTLYDWKNDPERVEDALALYRAYYQQQARYLSLLSQRELSFFIDYADFALAQNKPLKAVATIDIISPYIEDEAVLKQLKENLLLGFFQGGMCEEAEVEARKWIKEAEPAGSSALGWRLLAEINYEQEEYENTFWTAMHPIAFSNQMNMQHLDVCYALAILAAEEIRLKEEPLRLAAEMRDRGLAWPDYIEMLSGKAPEYFTVENTEPETTEEAIAIEQKPLQTPSPIDPIESLPTRIYN
ncbi:MAG: hypothetical protein VXY17_04830 [Verrucomicrobiota bacterium]|nr:hypothetical protein [Verrucomicrobiota bacterium]